MNKYKNLYIKVERYYYIIYIYIYTIYVYNIREVV